MPVLAQQLQHWADAPQQQMRAMQDLKVRAAALQDRLSDLHSEYMQSCAREVGAETRRATSAGWQPWTWCSAVPPLLSQISSARVPPVAK